MDARDIGQSLSFGLPVVTTNIGAEGIGLVDGENAMVSDDPEGFASDVICVYRDPSLWIALSEKGRDLILGGFSKEVVRQRLLALVN